MHAEVASTLTLGFTRDTTYLSPPQLTRLLSISRIESLRNRLAHELFPFSIEKRGRLAWLAVDSRYSTSILYETLIVPYESAGRLKSSWISRNRSPSNHNSILHFIDLTWRHSYILTSSYHNSSLTGCFERKILSKLIEQLATWIRRNRCVRI